MCDESESRMPGKQSNSSKELLYADVTGTTVVEHVLNSLQKSTDSARSEEINKFLRSKVGKSEAFKRAMRLFPLMEESNKGVCVEASDDDEKAIEVHLTIGNEDFDVKTEDSKADAWFILPQSEEQVSEKYFSNLSDDDEDSSSDSDSDSSDGEFLQNFSFSPKKNIVIHDESSNHENECQQL